MTISSHFPGGREGGDEGRGIPTSRDFASLSRDHFGRFDKLRAGKLLRQGQHREAGAGRPHPSGLPPSLSRLRQGFLLRSSTFALRATADRSSDAGHVGGRAELPSSSRGRGTTPDKMADRQVSDFRCQVSGLRPHPSLLPPPLSVSPCLRGKKNAFHHPLLRRWRHGDTERERRGGTPQESSLCELRPSRAAALLSHPSGLEMSLRSVQVSALRPPPPVQRKKRNLDMRISVIYVNPHGYDYQFD